MLADVGQNWPELGKVWPQVGQVWPMWSGNHSTTASESIFRFLLEHLFKFCLPRPIRRSTIWRAFVQIVFATPAARRGKSFERWSVNVGVGNSQRFTTTSVEVAPRRFCRRRQKESGRHRPCGVCQHRGPRRMSGEVGTDAKAPQPRCALFGAPTKLPGTGQELCRRRPEARGCKSDPVVPPPPQRHVAQSAGCAPLWRGDALNLLLGSTTPLRKTSGVGGGGRRGRSGHTRYPCAHAPPCRPRTHRPMSTGAVRCVNSWSPAFLVIDCAEYWQICIDINRLSNGRMPMLYGSHVESLATLCRSSCGRIGKETRQGSREGEEARVTSTRRGRARIRARDPVRRRAPLARAGNSGGVPRPPRREPGSPQA